MGIGAACDFLVFVLGALLCEAHALSKEQHTKRVL